MNQSIIQIVKRFFILVDKETDKVIYYTVRVTLKWVIIVVLLILLLIAYLMGNGTRTHIRADFTVNRFAFLVKERVKLKSIKFQAIDVSKFARIEMNPTQLEVKQADSSWRPVKLNELPVVITPEPSIELSKVTITTEEQNISNTAFFGNLEGFSIEPGTQVILETHADNPQNLTIKLSNPDSMVHSGQISLMYPKPFELGSEYVQANNADWPQQDKTVFKTRLPEIIQPRIKIFGQAKATNIPGQSNALELLLTVSAKNKLLTIFANDTFKITSLELFSRDEFRQPHTALVKEGEISYVGYPRTVSFKDRDFVTVGKQDELQIEKAIFDPQQPALSLRIQGNVTQAALRSPGFEEQDLLLTSYDKFKENEFAQIVLENLEWVIMAVIAITGIILVEDFKKLIQQLAREKKAEGKEERE